MTNPFDVPCMDYKLSFKAEDPTEVELKITYDDGTKDKAKCPHFTGKGRIEELLNVVESLESVVDDEDIGDEEKFLYFKKVLKQNPRHKWMSLNPETCLQEEGCKDRAYKKVTLEECTETQTHLSAEERQAFKEDSETDTDGFDGRIGCYSHTKINIRLKPNAKPVHKELCTIVTPYGKFQYNRLPMGIKLSPDVAQSLIKKIITDFDVEVYIDDIGT